MGFGLVTGSTDHLQIITASNSLTNSCTHLLTTAHPKSSQYVFTSPFLATAPSILCLGPY
jgi:hypothetical protein